MLLALSIACAPLDPASPLLGDTSRALFTDFADGDDAERVLDLETALLDLDVDGDVSDRTVALPVLDDPGVGGSSTPTDLQIPVAVATTSAFALDEHRDLAGVAERACMEPNSTVFTRRDFLTEPDCFLTGACARLDTANETRKKSAFSDISYDFRKDHLLVDLPDGRKALLARAWTDRPYAGANGPNSLDQIYVLEAWVETGNHDLVRYYALWSSATLPGVGDDAYAAIVRRGIEDSYDAAEAYLDGAPCDR